MISVRVKYNGGKVNLVGEGPQKYQWFALGQFAIRMIRERVARGVGSDDAPMPALSGRGSAISVDGRFVRQRPGYREQKQRFGGKPIRDLYGRGNQGGHMLDDLRVREATPTGVRMDITSRWGRIKARANEKRAPWFGFSPADQRSIFRQMAATLGGSVINIGAKERGGRFTFANSPANYFRRAA